ncbi:arf-GAP with Rho-GAP domain, ANK repeat and PH domain-containing protein 1 isoform X2 [Nelusetta ayraudi]|uniref:arf-GAP with Rho-GAP domain, ANK repeat and PH domain-containing protein 1 isoform X2 n=1 Tax=Nelusetta ayraudi TaxID=303726 RepID=UPI003F6FEAB5
MMSLSPTSAPVPKPRSRYMRHSLSSAPEENNVNVENPQKVFSDALQPSSGGVAPVDGPGFPTLTSVTNSIATNIPSLAGFAHSIGHNVPTATVPSAPPPPSVDSMVNSIDAHIPSLAGAANEVANPANARANATTNNVTTTVTTANADLAHLEKIVSSFSKIPSLAGMVSSFTNPLSSTATVAYPTAPPPSQQTTGNTHTDVGALSKLVMSTLGKDSGVTLPPLEGAAAQSGEGSGLDNPYQTVLSSWASQEEVDSESSNEEEDASVQPEGAVDPSNTNTAPVSPPGLVVPTRPAPPPPRPLGPSTKSVRKKKMPRSATIRVSRKKGVSKDTSGQSAVVRSSWLDVWKGFRYNVLWATFDGQLMSLWKKRTDRFSELVFHVSSITNVKKQEKGRFSVYFRKKHYDFMAQSDEVRDGWVTSLLASRGQQKSASSPLHGQITMKDTRSRAYAAVWGHDLWIYPNKDGFQLGIASFSIPLNVASIKSSGKHSFTLITPYKTFSLSVDSSKDLANWLDKLSLTISSALSCCQVALRLWENPDNKVCGDCGAANPEWASVNLLLVICHVCAGQHRGLGSSLSKVRSLKMDNKVWTEPLIQLFVTYGNRLANQIWAPAVPGAEQLLPESSDERRSKFIKDKYIQGRYRRVHALVSSQSAMDQRLCQVVCGDDVEETMFLICSGAKVSHSDPQMPSAILLAERAGQALQTQLLRLNEFMDVPPYQPVQTNMAQDHAPAGDDVEEVELHGKLEDDRFLFSLENNSAACDVLDLREVLSLFVKEGEAHEFELVTLSDNLNCAADHEEGLLSHMVHILKAILPGGVTYAEVGGASAVSKVCAVERGGTSSRCDVWLLLWDDGISVHPIDRQTRQPLRMELGALTRYEMDPSENSINMATADRSLSFRFEEQHSCQSWFDHLKRALSKWRETPRRPPPPPPNRSSTRKSLYPQIEPESRGSVPPAIERCISHITAHGLNVEGIYRRCGLATKVSRLVEALVTSPKTAPLESNEEGVVDAGSALKQYIRQQDSLFPERERQQWLHAAMISDENSRFSAYRRLIRQLPDDNRTTLNALFGHFYIVQMFSQVNKMSAHNLAVVLVPTLFQTMNPDLMRLTREFIIHHMLLFLTPGGGVRDGQVEVTFL